MRVIRLYKILNIHDLRKHNTTKIIFEKLRISGLKLNTLTDLN